MRTVNNNNINFIEPINAEANKTMFYSLQSLRKNDVAYTIKNLLLIIKFTIKWCWSGYKTDTKVQRKKLIVFVKQAST